MELRKVVQIGRADAGQIGIAFDERRGTDNRNGGNARRVFQGSQLGDHATERHADDVCRRESAPVQNADSIVGHVLERLGPFPVFIYRRVAGVAVVIADDKAPSIRQALAELVRPPEH